MKILALAFLLVLAGCSSSTVKRDEPQPTNLPADADLSRIHTQRTLNASGLYLRWDGTVAPLKDWEDTPGNDWQGRPAAQTPSKKTQHIDVKVEKPVRIKVPHEDQP